jgi:hypothetical protein
MALTTTTACLEVSPRSSATAIATAVDAWIDGLGPSHVYGFACVKLRDRVVYTIVYD